MCKLTMLQLKYNRYKLLKLLINIIYLLIIVNKTSGGFRCHSKLFFTNVYYCTKGLVHFMLYFV